LQARGFAAAAINGDIAQAQRERVIDQLKTGKLDILIATDVAARGLDVERISHVLNYDIPHDTESYVHRIGRTGRAGRSGEAILFVTPREKNLLRQIERATRQPIEQMQLPTIEAVNDTRVNKFNQRITDTLATGDLGLFQQLVEKYEQEHDVPAIEIAAALARIAQGDQPLLLEPPAKREYTERPPREYERERPSRDGGDFNDRRPVREGMRQPRPHVTEAGKRTYRIEVGHEHGVKPGNIVGAIANEGGVEAKFIGRVSIRDDYSLIDLPDGMPAETFNHLKKVWVAQQQLKIAEWDGKEAPQSGGGGGASRPPQRSGFRPSGARPGASGGGKPPRKKRDY
jgi:ATP-dependent RNA helicase DeaD